MNDNFSILLNKILQTNKYILDAGSRQGSFFYSENSKVIFLDNDISYLPEKKNNFIYADIVFLPFKKEIFDISILKYVLEHTYFPDKIISSINKVLKPNGYLIIAVPKWYSFQDLLYRLLGFLAQIFKRGKQAHIQLFSFKKICDLCYKNNFVLLCYKEYDSGLSFLDKTAKRKIFKKLIMRFISIIFEMTKINLLSKGEMYFIFQKIK
ncbi:MAG TPA: methyltransferase domain-containing protein [bacterium]|nr:methyltransferase domain-containing protein [bacterium]HOL47078.1 methyltransferase domain-containing protein [bacterium]